MTNRPEISASSEQATAEYDRRFALLRDRLVRVCTGLVGADAAEDVTQDAFIRGRSRWRQLRDDDLFDAWMTRMAINLCLNRHRSGRRLTQMVSILRRDRSEPTGRDVGLRELVERLPPRERTLVVLHYGHGYSLEEIARMSGLSPVNVRTIVFRARRRLAGQVKETDR